jgi:hypothetical protein
MAKITIYAEQIMGLPDTDHSISITRDQKLFGVLDIEPDAIGTRTLYDGRNPRCHSGLEEFQAVEVYGSQLLWIEERKEWIGITIKLIDSNFEGANYGIDEKLSVEGPCYLSSNCAKIIQRAYNRNDISLDQILTTSPEDLARK